MRLRPVTNFHLDVSRQLAELCVPGARLAITREHSLGMVLLDWGWRGLRVSHAAKSRTLLLAIALWCVGHPGPHTIVEMHRERDSCQRAQEGAQRIGFQGLRKQDAI